MRRLIPPTLRQWGCTHQWKEQSTKVLGDKLHRVRYYFCQSCKLRAKTREAPEVPWDEGTLMALVAQVFPEGVVAEVATLRTQGLLGGGLSGLNARLAPHRWWLDLVQDRGRIVGVVRRRILPEAPGGTITTRQKG